MEDSGSPIPISKFGGQESRRPATGVPLGKASIAEGTFHHSDLLTSARGSQKLSATRIPGSAYEINGAGTGHLQFDMPVRKKWWGHWSDTEDDKTVSIGWGFKLEGLAQLTDEVGDTLGGVMVSTNAQRTSPSLPQVAEAPTTRVRVKMVTNLAGKVVPGFHFLHRDNDIIFAPEDKSPTSDLFDFNEWFWTSLVFVWDKAAVEIKYRLEIWQQGINLDGTDSFATVQIEKDSGDSTNQRRWVIRALSLGGHLPVRWGHRGVTLPLHMLATEMRISQAAQLLPPWTGQADGSWVRWTLTDLVDPLNFDVFPLSETGCQFKGLLNTRGRLVGNGTHWVDSGPNNATDGLYFDGSGGIFLPNGAQLREAPTEDLPGYFLERDEISIGMWIHMPYRRWVWLADYLDTGGVPGAFFNRACLMCWSTPFTKNHGVPTDPVGAGPAERPGEHLRVELCVDFATKAVWIDIYFGELEPESLKHPTGYLGGSTVTTWPPKVAADGTPGQAWNKPLGVGHDPTAPRFRIEIGSTNDTPDEGLTHPFDFDWHIVVQRRFVDQGDAGNKISAYAHRYLNGIFDATAGPDGDGEFHDTVADGGAETKTFANQSCYTSVQLDVTNLNPSADAYAFSIGMACPNNYSDELGVDNQAGFDVYNLAERGVFPAKGSPSGFGQTDQLEGYPLQSVVIAHFYAIALYLRRDQRQLIVDEGEFGFKSRREFGDKIIAHYPLTDGGPVIRDFSGVDIDHDNPQHLMMLLREQTTDLDLVEMPETIPFFPLSEPSLHNEGAPFPEESSPITGVIQRIDETESESLFITATTGLYRYSRTTRVIERLLSIPGQGGPRRVSWAMDSNDVIHIVGGPGRPAIITRNNVVAYSGIFPPSYTAPFELITQLTGISGGFGIVFDSIFSEDVGDLEGFELANEQVYGWAVGYYSEVLKTRSAPGPVIHVRFRDPNTGQQGLQGFTFRYRLRLTGSLPRPTGFNAGLVTHWEIFRTGPNNEVLRLEWRIPIGDDQPAIFVGWRPDFELAEEANFFTYPAPRGMKHISMVGARMIGVGSSDEPRQVAHSLLNDAMGWPPLYRKTLTATVQAATGSATRRDRSFVTSIDYLYQLHDELRDADAAGNLPNPVQIIPIANKVGSLSGDAISEGGETGLFIPGIETVYLTEGGQHRKITRAVDSDGSAGDSWTWPDSWDTSKPEEFFSFHDERTNCYILCGPSKEDSSRIDALLVFYDHVEFSPQGFPIPMPEHSRVKDVKLKCATEILDPDTHEREIWAGTTTGHLVRFNVGGSHMMDDDNQVVNPKSGFVMSATTTTARLEGAYKSFSADVFRGATIRFYRLGVLVGSGVVTKIVKDDSWVDLTFDRLHGGLAGDFWTAGAFPMKWRSGKVGQAMTEHRISRVDLRFEPDG